MSKLLDHPKNGEALSLKLAELMEKIEKQDKIIHKLSAAIFESVENWEYLLTLKSQFLIHKHNDRAAIKRLKKLVKDYDEYCVYTDEESHE